MRRGRHNGYGFCKHRSMGGMAFLPDTYCCICGTPSYYTGDSQGNYYCEQHQQEKPLEAWTDEGRLTEEDFRRVLE